MKVSGIILAGGRSSRMKTNKALLKFNQQAMIRNVMNSLEKVATEIIIVTNDPTEYLDFEAMLVTDLYPRLGPISGIHAGLKAASFDYSFVVACDMPFINPDLLNYMLSQAKGYEVVVPYINNFYEPLHALYHKKCVPFIEKSLQEKRFKSSSFYEFIKVRKINEDEISPFTDVDKVFFNVNNPDDLEKAREMAGIKDGQEI